MKRIITLLMFVAAFTFSNEISAQKFPALDKSPADIAIYRTERGAPALIKTVYGRPMLKGRKLGSELAPYGKIWRTGANEATEVTFYKDATVGGKKLKAGTYVLHTIPGEKEWTVILNTNLNVWGAYQHDASKDVAKFTVPASSGDESLEAFSIAYAPAGGGVNLVLGWDKTRVAIPIKM
ncbi:DUF2911 domain-containing protein [Leptobacterium flavescens]|uniref:DUF2911 domain-containing protein n=1 Tax=Leptobacterium flavescens TaxID=472055 RepID=A0A6P0UQ89_9FLAO|nr:DUF2911 domain-containing protein [Leptobacterium flavescens]NER15295.1 DUF2911 domain-containing protein [Leptobacterium flavescens]